MSLLPEICRGLVIPVSWILFGNRVYADDQSKMRSLGGGEALIRDDHVLI